MKKITISIALVLFSICLWAGTKKLSIGNPPAQSTINVNSGATCLDGVRSAINRAKMLVELASWSSCAGRPIILKNLVKIDMDASVISGIKDNATSDDALYVYLSQLATPITQASRSLIDIIRRGNETPQCSFSVVGDSQSSKDIGMQTLQLSATNSSCLQNLTASFNEEAPCSVISQRLVNGNYIFDIYVDPGRFRSTRNSFPGDTCEWSIRKDDVVMSGSFEVGTTCDTVRRDSCDTVDYDSARILGCTDTFLVTRAMEQGVSRLQFSDRAMLVVDSSLVIESSSPEPEDPTPPTASVCNWSRPP